MNQNTRRIMLASIVMNWTASEWGGMYYMNAHATRPP